MTDETTKPKLTIAEREAKTIELLKSNRATIDIMNDLGVSSTYVYKIRKKTGMLLPKKPKEVKVPKEAKPKTETKPKVEAKPKEAKPKTETVAKQ